MAVAAIETSQTLITWRYLWWALTAIAVMLAAIMAGNLWLLNFIHVFSSLLWTGVDLFMGFVLGPIVRRVDLSARREIVRRLTPRTLFLMPTVSIISGTTGWFLAVNLGYTALAWPAYSWVAAALVLVTLMTVQGLGFLTPVNVLVCLELQKSNPDLNKIGVWMQRYFYAVAMQGMMQVAIIVVMTRLQQRANFAPMARIDGHQDVIKHGEGESFTKGMFHQRKIKAKPHRILVAFTMIGAGRKLAATVEIDVER
jgi:uncharacterized membrane protein